MAQIGREADSSGKNDLSTYNCKIDIKPKLVNKEEQNYRELPKFYTFGSDGEREETLRNDLFKINQEVAEIVASFQ